MSKRDSLSDTTRDHLRVVIDSVREQADRDRRAAREYEDLRHASLSERMALEFKMRDVALDLAATNVGASMSHLNELRQDFTRKEGKFATKDDLSGRIDTVNAEVRALRDSLTAAIKGLELWQAALSAKASMTHVYVVYLISLLGLLLAAIRLWKG